MFHSREIVVNQPDGSGPGARGNGRGPSPLLAGEPVAYSVDRLYVLARGLDLRPQAPDVDVHRPRPAKVVVSPDALQQFFPGVRAARGRRQHLEEFVLL